MSRLCFALLLYLAIIAFIIHIRLPILFETSSSDNIYLMKTYGSGANETLITFPVSCAVVAIVCLIYSHKVYAQ